jgi:CelD/BcsL family acetyltransferase involved in cellulose biosynthesis
MDLESSRAAEPFGPASQAARRRLLGRRAAGDSGDSLENDRRRDRAPRDVRMTGLRDTVRATGAGVAVPVEVRCVSDLAEFHELGREWNDVLARSGTRNLFLSWEWISTWWDVYGGASTSTLHVLVARGPDGATLGIAPLRLRRRRLFGVGYLSVAEFIGAGSDVTPDGLDVFAATGHEDAVVAAFGRALATDARVQAVDLRPFAGESRNLPLLQQALERHGTVEVHNHSVCPVMNLPSTWEAFVADRSRNYRKKMGEYERRLARDLDARLRRSETPEDLARDMAALVKLHRERWGRESRAFRSREYLRFHERLARRMLDRNALRLFTLESGSRPLAMLYCFSDGHRYYYYQAGRDPELARYRVGFVLMHKAMRAAIDEGVEVFDFLRGAEDYKYHWAVRHQMNVQLQCWKTWLGRIVARVERLQRQSRARRRGSR